MIQFYNEGDLVEVGPEAHPTRGIVLHATYADEIDELDPMSSVGTPIHSYHVPVYLVGFVENHKSLLQAVEDKDWWWREWVFEDDLHLLDRSGVE